jgi:hypothetical protein
MESLLLLFMNYFLDYLIFSNYLNNIECFQMFDIYGGKWQIVY